MSGKLTSNPAFTEPEAKRMAADVLEEEANQLAMLIGDKEHEKMPHRFHQAIHREIQRLRAIANALAP